jgi:hypothetical protein
MTINQPADDDFVRHHLPIIFDVPRELADDPQRTVEVLNLLSLHITQHLEQDERFQRMLRRFGVEWGWELGTWE